VKALRQLANRLLALARWRRLDAELDDEIRAHIEMAERDAIRSGLSADEARREARRAFGGIEQIREAHREERSARWVETVVGDIRYGCTLLVRAPGFSLVAIGILAIGIGANAAMFSLVDGVLLKPMPFPQPERVVRVWEAPTPTSINRTTAANFAEWRRQGTCFEALSADVRTNATALVGGEPIRLAGKLVSAGYFDVFGIRPLIGRTFAAGEDQPDAPYVVVLSHATWQGRFGGDAGILDRDLLLDGERHRIIGVMPAGTFDRDDMSQPGEAPAAFWKPLVLGPERLAAGDHNLAAAGRLRAGTTLAQAGQQMRAIHAVLARDLRDSLKDWSVTIEPFDERLIDSGMRRSLYVAFGAVFLMLLIACSNVANLLLGKGAARQKEMAVRAALGASRGRLVRQLLTETLVLCLLGTAAGLVVATYVIGAAVPLMPRGIPSTAVVGLDYRVFGFASLVAVGVTLLVGLVPSLRTSSDTLSLALSQSSRTTSGARGRLRRMVVVAEVALSLMLVCGALLLLRTLLNLQRVDVGVRVENVVTVPVDLPAAMYPRPEAAAAFFLTVTERLAAVPGVDRASLADNAPLEGAGGELLQPRGGNEPLLVRYKRVGPGYFGALNVPVVAGREFTSEDRAGSVPVTVISQELARILSDRFGMKDPIGQIVGLPALGYEGGATGVYMRVVGVIRGERVNRDLRLPMDPVAYVPLMQSPRRGVNLIVRTKDDPGAAIPAIREAVRKIDPRLALSQVRTLAQIRRQRSLSGAAEPAWLVGAFAALAALLAGLGLYGVLAQSVVQQRREIGIRMALGANRREVVGYVLKGAGGMVALGLVAGLAGAMALGRVMAGLLFEVSPLDPAVLLSAAGLMALVGFAAAALPASRAARVDPTAALRSEE
jgi:putative ABC transport system permease protein